MWRLTIFLSCISITVFSQTDSATSKKLSVNAYAEVYYSYDLGKPLNGNKAPFLYSYHKHNSVALNLAYVRFGYQSKRFRAVFTPAIGTYINQNLTAESGIMQNVFEANIGYQISAKQQLWIDGGIFPSHIGLESAVGKDCWNLSRSIAAENSPYYESGYRISYTSHNNKWYMALLYLNGWQRSFFRRNDDQFKSSFGHQLTFKPNQSLTINSSSFLGSEKSNSYKLQRYFHNFYAIGQLNKSFSIAAGFDVGFEQIPTDLQHYNKWSSIYSFFRFQPLKKQTVAARIEYYHDSKNVLITPNPINKFRAWGYSVNYDIQLNRYALWRIEARNLSSTDPIFYNRGSLNDRNLFFTTAVSLSF